jgi:prophage regulatory protein
MKFNKAGMIQRDASILGNKVWYRVKDLSEILSMSDSTIWKMVKKGTFPKPKHITKRMTVWLRQDISDWVEAKTKDRR